MEISIKYFANSMGDKVRKIFRVTNGDWIDLRAAEDVEMKKGELRLIPLGVGMILPDGYEAWVLPRSSTPRRFGIISANSMGIIDNSYNGNDDQWGFMAYAIRDTVIRKDDRICQFRVIRNQPRLWFKAVTCLKEISRGGFGSTGRN
uniref:dUTP diphosphatase n=1 Tax=Anaerobutyricum hallii TaxID=39488 RepID=UPI003FF0B80C